MFVTRWKHVQHVHCQRSWMHRFPAVGLVLFAKGKCSILYLHIPKDEVYLLEGFLTSLITIRLTLIKICQMSKSDSKEELTSGRKKYTKGILRARNMQKSL